MGGQSSERSRRGWKGILFPEPERRAPGERHLRTLLRTVHIASMAVLLGGHFFEAPAGSLRGALVWTVASGLGIVALELYGTLNWLFEVRGLATMFKIGVLCLVPLFWPQRVWLLMAVLAIGSVSSHTTGGIRHYSLLTGRPAERKSG